MKNVLMYKKPIKRRFDDAIALYKGVNYFHALDEFISLVDDGCHEAFGYLGSIYESDEIGKLRDLDKAFFYYSESVSRVG